MSQRAWKAKKGSRDGLLRRCACDGDVVKHTKVEHSVMKGHDSNDLLGPHASLSHDPPKPGVTFAHLDKQAFA